MPISSGDIPKGAQGVKRSPKVEGAIKRSEERGASMKREWPMPKVERRGKDSISHNPSMLRNRPKVSKG